MEADNSQQAVQSLLYAIFKDSPHLKKRIDDLGTLNVSDAARERRRLEMEFTESLERVLTARQHRSLGPYISELAEFNYKDTGESLAEFISSVILSHAIDAPWILDAEVVRNVGLRWQSDAGQYPRQRLYIPSTADEDLFAYDDLPPTDNADFRVLISGERQWKTEPLPRLSRLPAGLGFAHHFRGESAFEKDLSFQLDCLLGVGGTNPLNPEALRQIDCADPSVHETLLREFRSHVKFERIGEFTGGFGEGGRHKIRAVIVLGNRDSLGDHGIFARIVKMMDALERAILLCQERGMCLFGIPFFARKPSDKRLSFTLVAISTVVKFFTGFRSLEEYYMKWAQEEVSERAESSAQAAAVAGFATGAGLGLGLVGFPLSAIAFPVIALAGWGLAKFGAAAVAEFEGTAEPAATRAFAWSRRTKPPNVFEIADLATDILRACGIETKNEMDPRLHKEEERFPGLLHYCSLAVQCLSLGIQLSARGLTLPLDSVFLEHKIDEFVLQGINSRPDVYVTEQEITCLGGLMPSHRVPVFGARSRSSVSFPVDVVTSIKDLLSVWGPGVVELTNTQHSPQPRITGIKLGGGVLFPVKDKASPSLSRWHWTDDNTSRKGTINPYSAVDLDTNIQVGAPGSNVRTTASISTATRPVTVLPVVRQSEETSPGTFITIGPSSINPACLFSTWIRDAIRRRYMSNHIKDIGTHGPFLEFAGYDVGAQAGNYLLLQVMKKYERRQGITLKDRILQNWSGMPQLLKGLDKTCGLFVSSCTKVMVRARLRDLIAFAGPLVLPEAFPLLFRKGPEDSIATWVRALCGSQNLYDWARSQMNHQGNPLTSAEESVKVKDLILGVLRILAPTGITGTGSFSTAWVSPREVIGVVTSRCQRGSWLTLLADSEFSATFACVTPLCLTTRDSFCLNETGSPWHCSFKRGLGDFTLSTRVSPYFDLPKKNASMKFTGFEVGRSYHINTRDFETVATLREVDGTDEPFHVFEVKKTMLGTLLKRSYFQRGTRFIRESDDPNSSPCLIIGNG